MIAWLVFCDCMIFVLFNFAWLHESFCLRFMVWFWWTFEFSCDFIACSFLIWLAPLIDDLPWFVLRMVWNLHGFKTRHACVVNCKQHGLSFELFETYHICLHLAQKNSIHHAQTKTKNRIQWTRASGNVGASGIWSCMYRYLWNHVWWEASQQILQVEDFIFATFPSVPSRNFLRTLEAIEGEPVPFLVGTPQKILQQFCKTDDYSKLMDESLQRQSDKLTFCLYHDDCIAGNVLGPLKQSKCTLYYGSFFES